MATTDPQIPVQTGYAPVNGLSVYYEIHGEGRPLVLLHGAYMTIDTMGPILPRSAATRQVSPSSSKDMGIRPTPIARSPTSRWRTTPPRCSAPRGRQRGHRRLQHGRRDRPAAGDPPTRGGAQARRRLGLVHQRPHARGGARDVPLDHTRAVRRVADRGGVPRTAPNPDDFPQLVEKLKQLDTTAFAWPDDDIRPIAAPTMILRADSDGVRLEHAIELFRLLGGG